MVTLDTTEIRASRAHSHFVSVQQLAIESILLIKDPRQAREVMFHRPPAKVRMVRRNFTCWELLFRTHRSHAHTHTPPPPRSFFLRLCLRRPGSHVAYACACVVRVNQPLVRTTFCSWRTGHARVTLLSRARRFWGCSPRVHALQSFSRTQVSRAIFWRQITCALFDKFW